MTATKEEFRGILPADLILYLTAETEEIRFRRNRPVIFLENGQELVTPYRFDEKQMDDLVDQLTEGSLSSYFDTIRQGFITIKGGHRVGLSGTAVYEDNRLTYLKDISSVNLRVAKEVIGAADELFQVVGHLDPLPGILMISPPGHGKTTLLRDFLRQLSEKRPGIRISLIDERGEIAATHHGTAQNNLGGRCDILNGYQKSDGIPMAIRSLSPNVIAVDEIGNREDESSLLTAYHAGISVVATIHGDENGTFKQTIQKLMEEQVFSYLVYLRRTDTFHRTITIQKVECP